MPEIAIISVSYPPEGPDNVQAKKTFSSSWELSMGITTWLEHVVQNGPIPVQHGSFGQVFQHFKSNSDEIMDEIWWKWSFLKGRKGNLLSFNV